MGKRNRTATQLFKNSSYIAEEDADTAEVSIEFAHARYFTTVRFILLASERHRYDDAEYIDGLIYAYHRDHANFCRKRKVTEG